MTLPAVPRFHRRTLVLYLVTIVLPGMVFLWLGISAFEDKTRALRSLTRQAIDRAVHDRTLDAARHALSHPDDAIVEYTFTFEDGKLADPVIDEPLPEAMPSGFSEAYRQEADRRYDVALALFEKLQKVQPALALQGMARCLDELKRDDEARALWRKLAATYPDERDLSQRPYGVFAAIAAGDTTGLVEKIESGRWPLSFEQASLALDELAPGRPSRYLQRILFGRTLANDFQPPGGLPDSEPREGGFRHTRLFYRSDKPGHVTGFSVNDAWITQSLIPSIERNLDPPGATQRDLRIYVASVALVLVMLSAGMILLLRDVSREAETSRARAELVSSVSHELKTPITLVRLYSETLLRHSFDEQERAGFYRIIARESTRLGRLIDQVLTFSRVERGAQIYRLEEGDLSSLVSGVIDDYRDYLEHSGFVLHQTAPADLPSLRFDPAAISQALVNLLNNAVKYSGQQREISVRVGVCDAHVAVEVEDCGIGIPAAEQTRIFERFYRGRNADAKGGYGLGLFLVRHIMDAHGGRAEVRSEPGKGSLFRLLLPIVQS